MKRARLAWVMAVISLGAAAPEYFEVKASFAPPPKAGADGAVVVWFTPTTQGIHVNEKPAPYMKLAPEQRVLVDKQPPQDHAGPVDPTKARYLDPKVPVRFPVAVSPGAPKGTQAVKATVFYFYCSKAEGWCRKGRADIALSVPVP